MKKFIFLLILWGIWTQGKSQAITKVVTPTNKPLEYQVYIQHNSQVHKLSSKQGYISLATFQRLDSTIQNVEEVQKIFGEDKIIIHLAKYQNKIYALPKEFMGSRLQLNNIFRKKIVTLPRDY